MLAKLVCLSLGEWLSCVSPYREVWPSLSTQLLSYSGRRLLIPNDFLKEFPGVNLSKPLEIKNSASQTLSYHIKAGKNQNASVYLCSGRYSEGLIPDGISTLACKTVISYILQLRQTGERYSSWKPCSVSQETSLLLLLVLKQKPYYVPFFLKDWFLNTVGTEATGF